MKRFVLFTLALVLIVALFVSCSTPPKYLEKSWRPGTIAIMPFTNDSADVAVEKFARVLVYNQLKNRGYAVLALDQVDTALNDLGVTEAGQLSALPDEELVRAVDADCFLFGHVIDAKRVMLGVYFEKLFHAEFKILDAQSQAIAFEDENIDKESRFTLNPADILATAAQEFAVELAVDTIMTLLNSHPLYTQMDNVVTKTIVKIPPKREK